MTMTNNPLLEDFVIRRIKLHVQSGMQFTTARNYAIKEAIATLGQEAIDRSDIRPVAEAPTDGEILLAAFNEKLEGTSYHPENDAPVEIQIAFEYAAMKLREHINNNPANISIATVKREEVVRDSDGQWRHSQLPEFAEADCLVTWLTRRNLKSCVTRMETELYDHQVEDFERGRIGIKDWTPNLDIPNAFLLAIYDTTDGPEALWAYAE